MATFIVDIYWPRPGIVWPEDTARAIRITSVPPASASDGNPLDEMELVASAALASLTPAERVGAVVGTVREVSS